MSSSKIIKYLLLLFACFITEQMVAKELYVCIKKDTVLSNNIHLKQGEVFLAQTIPGTYSFSPITFQLSIGDERLILEDTIRANVKSYFEFGVNPSKDNLTRIFTTSTNDLIIQNTDNEQSIFYMIPPKTWIEVLPNQFKVEKDLFANASIRVCKPQCISTTYKMSSLKPGLIKQLLNPNWVRVSSLDITTVRDIQFLLPFTHTIEYKSKEYTVKKEVEYEHIEKGALREGVTEFQLIVGDTLFTGQVTHGVALISNHTPTIYLFPLLLLVIAGCVFYYFRSLPRVKSMVVKITEKPVQIKRIENFCTYKNQLEIWSGADVVMNAKCTILFDKKLRNAAHDGIKAFLTFGCARTEPINGNDPFVFTAASGMQNLNNNEPTEITLTQDPHNPKAYIANIQCKGGLGNATNPPVFNNANRHKFKITFKLEMADIKPSDDSYSFEICEDLGSVCVGFDPGTTGSSISVSSGNPTQLAHLYPLLIGGEDNESAIIPSVLVFNNPAIQDQTVSTAIPGEHYKYGQNAWIDQTQANTRIQSMKKLLGYDNDKPEILIDNTPKRLFNGRELVSLLVKGLFKDMNTYFGTTLANDPNKEFWCNRDNQTHQLLPFNPKRAVVAVPNTFSMRKTQGMVDAIKSLDQFHAITYIYEAEAALLSLFIGEEDRRKYNRKIVVFDMGGGTINVSAFKTTDAQVTGTYHTTVDTLGRVGFGVGGDAIDYCIIKAILKMEPIVERLNEINQTAPQFMKENKSALIKLAKDYVKLEMIKCYNDNEDCLIEPRPLFTQIAADVTQIFPEDSIIDDDSWEIKWKEAVYLLFKKNNRGVYPIFETEEFTSIVYNSVSESVFELCNFGDVVDCFSGKAIEVVFTGRSTSFPFIKEQVMESLKKKFPLAHPLNSDDNIDTLKTRVANGACYYGLQLVHFTLVNNKTFYKYGYLKNDAPNTFNFITVIDFGKRFDNDSQSIYDPRAENSTFPCNDNNAIFYQIIGHDPVNYIRNRNRLKCVELFRFNAGNTIKGFNSRLEVNESFHVEAIFDYGHAPISKNTNIEQNDIATDHDEFYTFSIS